MFHVRIVNRPLVAFSLSVVVCFSCGSAIHVARDDPAYGKPCQQNLIAVNETKYPPRTGQETGYDLREELKTMKPSLAREIIELAAPQSGERHLLREASTFSGKVNETTNPGGKCTLKRFDEYALCEEFTTTMAPKGHKWTALSFGGNNHDSWSSEIRKSLMKEQQDVVPQVFDCYDPRPIPGTVMHEACIGGRSEREMKHKKDGRTWQDLDDILKNERPRSVLMKIDIEHSEFGVLQELSADSFGKIAFLTVEYHFFGGFGTRCCGFEEMKELFQKLQKDFLVLDGEALRWGKDLTDCGIAGGYAWPPLLSVSYVARDVL